jgi:acyl phosphate:glycerol-3-phosphate acyltransferase
MGWLWFAIVGYLFGSIPFGLLLTRWSGLGDVRQVGSGNIGATNVLRMGNKKIAAATLICDALKGYFPVLAAQYLGTPESMIAAGLGAFVGHLFPVWLKFKGGKGVATGIGVFFGWWWGLGLVLCAAWLLVFLAMRISSVSALVAFLAAAIVGWVYGLQLSAFAVPITIIAAAVWIMHRANIARILKGEEPKTSFSKKKEDAQPAGQ